MTIAKRLLSEDIVNEELTPDEFSEKVRSLFLKQFPKGWMYGGYEKNLGESVQFVFGIQNQSKWLNKIEHNDPARQIISIYDVKNREFPDKITVESSGNSVLTKPPADSYLAYGRVKFGWRKKTGTPEQIIKHMDAYFKKMRKVVDANKDNIPFDLG